MVTFSDLTIEETAFLEIVNLIRDLPPEPRWELLGMLDAFVERQRARGAALKWVLEE